MIRGQNQEQHEAALEEMARLESGLLELNDVGRTEGSPPAACAEAAHLPALLDYVADPVELRREQLLQATAIGVTAATGEAFFRLLSRHLAHTLQAACAVVGVLTSDRANRVRTLAFYCNHQWLPNFEYDLAGTPCANVVARRLCVYPSGVQELFPEDRWLADNDIESYAGTPLYDSRGRVLGLISVLGREPLVDADAARFALQIFAARAAAEIERQAAEESLRASQAALAESEERFRQMAETIRDLFWLFDLRERRFLYISPAYEAIWGRPPEWTVSDPNRWLEAVYEDDRALAGGMRWPLVAGKVFDEEYRIRRPDGTIRWIHDRRYAVAASGDECFRLAGVTEDITDRHQAAERVEQQVAHLAHMARLSTVGELVAGISHEINQPLYAIANFSSAIGQLLRAPGELKLDQLRHFNDEVARSAIRAGEIIRRVRSYVSRGPTERRPVELTAIVEESAALLAAEARRQRVQVVLELSRSCPPLSADAVGIQQVLVNLLRNALEAMERMPPDAPRFVRVHSHIRDAEVEVAVDDVGSGLSDEDLANVFNPFYSTKPDGMGMGLAISKTIVEAHGGRIGASRGAGCGSRFWFTLPLDA